MKSGKTKILIIGLVTFLVIVGLNSMFVNALDFSGFSESGSISLDDTQAVSDISIPESPEHAPPQPKEKCIQIKDPGDGESFLEPLDNEKMKIYVVDQNGNPVERALVTIKDDAFAKYTNENGKVWWPMPNVDFDTEYTIKAEYTDGEGEGYYDDVTVKIRNRVLEIFSPDFHDDVLEGRSFVVIVRDQDHVLMESVKVTFDGKTKTTNSDGEASFTAPYVTNDKEFLIKVSADGYASDIVFIDVINMDNPSSCTISGEVRNFYYEPIANAEIAVALEDGSIFYTSTDEYGMYELPSFIPKEGGEQVTVTASKLSQGYLTKHAKITVNCGTNGIEASDQESDFEFDDQKSQEYAVNFWLLTEYNPKYT